MERVRRVELPTLCLAKIGGAKAADDAKSSKSLTFPQLTIKTFEFLLS